MTTITLDWYCADRREDFEIRVTVGKGEVRVLDVHRYRDNAEAPYMLREIDERHHDAIRALARRALEDEEDAKEQARLDRAASDAYDAAEDRGVARWRGET